MADVSSREELIAKILAMSDEQFETLLRIANAIQEKDRPTYDPDNDPLIGFAKGPTDLSQRYKQILRDEIDPRSGWTLKDKLE